MQVPGGTTYEIASLRDVRSSAVAAEVMEATSAAGEFETLTLEEAAALLRVTSRTVRRLVGAGRIPHARVGRSLRFLRSQLLIWLGAGGTRVPESGPEVIGEVTPRSRSRKAVPEWVNQLGTRSS